MLCYDHSRVVLSQEDEDPTSDYINANFVDGYKQKNAYISTQGPLPKTSYDFWRMVWEQHCLVIVMTTRVMERGRVKCGQYWEPTEGALAEYGCYQVRTMTVEANEDYTVAEMELKNTKVRGTGRFDLRGVLMNLVCFFFCRLMRCVACPTGSLPVGRTTASRRRPGPC